MRSISRSTRSDVDRESRGLKIFIDPMRGGRSCEPRAQDRECREDISARSWLDQLRAVIVGRVAVDRVDVIEVALLRRILDDERRSLDAVVRQAAVRRRSAPGEIGLAAGWL